MAELTPQQAIWRDRIEGLIAMAAPALDLLLTAGDRISRIVEREDRDYYPVRSAGDAALPADLRRHSDGRSEGDSAPPDSAGA